MNEEYAQYLGRQYDLQVEARYREIAASSKPVRFPRNSKSQDSKDSDHTHYEEIPRRYALEEKIHICSECGNPYQKRKNSTLKFCSRTCSKQARRRNKKTKKAGEAKLNG